MKRLRKSLAVAAMAVVMGFLVAGCGGSGPVSGPIKSAISSLSPSRTASISLPTNGPPTPTAEAPPTSEALAPTAAAAASPAASESSSSLPWLWIALAAVVLIGLVVWIARASGRRSAAASARAPRWLTRTRRARRWPMRYASPTGPGCPARTPGAAGRPPGPRGRLSRELYRLRESASDEGERMRLEDTLDSLRGLRSAMADEQAAGSAGGPGSPEAMQVHGRLMAFEESLRALRAPYEQMPRI